MPLSSIRLTGAEVIFASGMQKADIDGRRLVVVQHILDDVALRLQLVRVDPYEVCRKVERLRSAARRSSV